MRRIIATLFSTIWFFFSYSQTYESHYDETRVPEYSLPDLLITANGVSVSTIKEWEETRREEILQLFKNEFYGNVPEIKGVKVKSSIIEQGFAFEGLSIRKQVLLVVSKNEKTLTVNVLLYLPKNVENPPMIFGYNYYGNQSITPDPEVILTNSWIKNNPAFSITENKATEVSRGKRGYRWPIEMILREGFGLVTVYYGDIDPDRNNFDDGLHPFFYQDGQKEPNENEWGAIGAWAWGASRVMDYLQTDVDTRDSKTIIFGHSRLGKTSLWAGAQDQRFDMVISNESGCGGAAISRRRYGETIAIINQKFPHWFADRLSYYNEKEDQLPVDQHMLIALMAPRPVYIGSAHEDQWADPKGEYLSGFHAGLVYSLYDRSVLMDPEPPGVDHPLHEAVIGYHERSGEHDVTDYDWKQYIAFAQKWLMIE